MCVGGMLTLHVPGRGRSVRLGVVEALRRPDVFVAGTLNASSAAEASGGRLGGGACAPHSPACRRSRPFAAAPVEPQPTRDELIAALRASGRWEAYARQASGAGEGRLSAADADPRLWLPTMLSPALGNLSGHTLREFHYQARCMRMIEGARARGRREAVRPRALYAARARVAAAPPAPGAPRSGRDVGPGRRGQLRRRRSALARARAPPRGSWVGGTPSWTAAPLRWCTATVAAAATWRWRG